MGKFDPVAYARRELVLNAWAEGKTHPQIMELVSGAVGDEYSRTVVERARAAGDPRAAPRREKAPPMDEALYERAMDLLALGTPKPEIERILDIPRSKLRTITDNASRRGDERVRKRPATEAQIAKAYEKSREHGMPVEKIAVYTTDTTVLNQPRTVSVREVSIGRKPDPLRPVRESVARAQTSSIDMTAALMGDPPPHRSALGRECRPDEYASRGGEGRWRDPFLSGGAGGLQAVIALSQRKLFNRAGTEGTKVPAQRAEPTQRAHKPTGLHIRAHGLW